MGKGRWFAPAAFLLAAAGLAGCAPTGTQAFQQGYGDGCRSGYAGANRPGYETVKDDKRFESDTEYRTGWLEANETCYEAALRRTRGLGGRGGGR
ncbi:MAG: hypothetical protein ACREGL_02225 [Alphaproteobacteria bacterium]